jgi:hypothetical protein
MNLEQLFWAGGLGSIHISSIIIPIQISARESEFQSSDTKLHIHDKASSMLSYSISKYETVEMNIYLVPTLRSKLRHKVMRKRDRAQRWQCCREGVGVPVHLPSWKRVGNEHPAPKQRGRNSWLNALPCGERSFDPQLQRLPPVTLGPKTVLCFLLSPIDYLMFCH